MCFHQCYSSVPVWICCSVWWEQGLCELFLSFLHSYLSHCLTGMLSCWLVHQKCSPWPITLPPPSAPLFFPVFSWEETTAHCLPGQWELVCIAVCCELQRTCQSVQHKGFGLCRPGRPGDICIYQATGIAYCPLVIPGSCNDLVPGGESRKTSAAISGDQRSEGAGFLLYLCVVNLEFWLHKFIWDHVKIKLTVCCLHFPIAFFFFSFCF